MIETERLKLRLIQQSDSAAIFEYRSDAVTNKYQGFIPKTIEEVNEFIAKTPVQFNQTETWFQLVMIEKESGKLIGDLGVHFIGEDGFQCELGCTLNKNYHGKGLATEAMKMTIDYLFNSLSKHRIIASVDPQNVPSIRLLERLNFRQEAHFRESLLIDGKWVDDVIYGLLKKDWKP